MHFHVRIITFHRGEADISTHEEEEEEEEVIILFLLLALVRHHVRNGAIRRDVPFRLPG